MSALGSLRKQIARQAVKHLAPEVEFKGAPIRSWKGTITRAERRALEQSALKGLVAAERKGNS